MQDAGAENSNTDHIQEYGQTETTTKQAVQQIETEKKQIDRRTEITREPVGRQTETSRKRAGRQNESGKRVNSSGVSKRFRIHDLNSIIKEIKVISADLNRKKEAVNEFEIFGKSVGVQLKSLFEEDAVMAQKEIQSILTSYRLKKIRYTNEMSCISHTTPSIHERSQSRQSDSDG